MFMKRYGSWFVYAAFVFIAMYFHSGEPLFTSDGQYAAGKLITWALYIGFLVYSIYCTSQENIVKTVKSIYPYHWARQIGLDLYLGVFISMFIIYLNEGSLLVLALWLLPILVFANLAILLYMAMNFNSIVSHFV